MGDSGALILAFPYASDLSNDAKQGNSMLALGDSISFGRFMSEPLSWEKWSAFSHKKYVEEAERYSQPGSVAQKKAFFEAHYKRIASQKAAALLEQANSVGQQNISDADKSHGVTGLIQHNQEFEKFKESASDKLDKMVPLTEKEEALMDSPGKKYPIDLEKKGSVYGSEASELPEVDNSLLKVIEIDKQNSNANRGKQSVIRKKNSTLSSLKSWLRHKTSNVPRSEKRSHSKLQIARQNKVEEIHKEKTGKDFRKACGVCCFMA